MNYNSRKSKQEFLLDQYKQYLQGSVLDVGCWNNYLKELLPSQRIVGIDFAGKPDIIYDLEKGTLPFKDDEFTTAIALDVLEHLDSLHEIFEEMLRVSESYVVIALPNCASLKFIYALLFNKRTKYYGLPLEKPSDRHRWFFTALQIQDFFLKNQDKYDYVVEREMFVRNRPSGIKSVVYKILEKSLGLISPNLFVQSYWVVLKKN